MDIALFATLSFGIVVILGGIIGYWQAGSKISLLSGCISGILLLICAFGLGQNYGWAKPLAIIITTALVVIFTFRLQKSRKFMPAGLMVILGVISWFLMVFN